MVSHSESLHIQNGCGTDKSFNSNTPTINNNLLKSKPDFIVFRIAERVVKL